MLVAARRTSCLYARGASQAWMRRKTSVATSFDQLGVPEYLLPAIERMKWKTPTTVQARVLPTAFKAHKNVVASAETGSGKTAAFALPALKAVHDYKESAAPTHHADDEVLQEDAYGRLPRGQFSPLALILCPTRELASQVSGQVQELAAGVAGRKTTAECLAYSTNLATTGSRLKGRKLDVAVCTAGSLLEMLRERTKLLKELPMDGGVAEPILARDHPANRTLDLSHVRLLVMDECDRMLSMGFFPDIKDILKYLPRPRKNLKKVLRQEMSTERQEGRKVYVGMEDRMQVLLFSATLLPECEELITRLAPKHVRCNLNSKLLPAASISQRCYEVSNRRKTALLLYLLRRRGSMKGKQVLVFCRTQQRTERLVTALKDGGINATFVHSEVSSAQRQAALSAFKAGETQVLVSTDLAARGIDVEDLPAVVNFDVATSPEDHVHRVGRTGRAGKEGLAVTFLSRTPSLVDFAGKLVELNEYQMLNKIRALSPESKSSLRPTKVPGPWRDDDVEKVAEEEKEAQKYSARRADEIAKLLEKKARRAGERMHEREDVAEKGMLSVMERRVKMKEALPSNKRYGSVSRKAPEVSLRSLKEGRYEDVLHSWDTKRAAKRGIHLAQAKSTKRGAKAK